ncbi:hypothetical protein IP78_11275 [Brevundimonas sp. AAP58]|uniref:DUF58 domain-containing protein n=1 Tax=Brevundimonas sp. AAP58 TaxID=1523422 RepID=UPI0006B9F23B|nr:DUF58 domain-containing protein [Brevundimonas sp. AAP58]KPF78374.1 hypothetical protein IP78_11275 [Brevundimonas sp. AAP58]
MSPLDLPPDLRTRLRRLSITPRRAAVIASAGQHASRNRGGAQEFAQYRAYERGDDLRQIDWKLYARSDRFFVRDAERESPVTVWIVLDASASMAQADLKTPNWSRFDAARRLAAALVEIAVNQGDRFGLVIETATGPMVVPPGGGARQRDRVLLTMAPIQPAGIALWDRDVGVYGERFGPNDVILILSDGFDAACIETAERLAMSGRDVAMIRVLTADERDFPFDQGYRFVDPETGAALVGDGPALRVDFLRRFAEAREALSDRLDAHGVRHAEHFADRPADEPIRALFRPEATR